MAQRSTAQHTCRLQQVQGAALQRTEQATVPPVNMHLKGLMCVHVFAPGQEQGHLKGTQATPHSTHRIKHPSFAISACNCCVQSPLYKKSPLNTHTCLRMGMTIACQEWSARGKRLCQRDTPGGFTKKPCSAARPTPGCTHRGKGRGTRSSSNGNKRVGLSRRARIHKLICYGRYSAMNTIT
jgi:hypothetical protein